MRPTVNLSEVCDFIRGITFSKSDQVETGNDFIFVATTKAAQADGLHFDDLVKVKREKLKNDETILQEGDILISIANSLNLLGRKTFIDDLKNQDISFGAFMGCLRVNRDKILPRFLSYILDGNDYKNFCISEANTTTNISNIKWSTLGLFEIPLPPLETQKAIVAKLDQIFAELDQTKSEIQKNLDNTDELWKSALNQAFQGDWEMNKLGEVAEIGPKKAEISLDENTKVSFVPMSDLSQEEMLFQTKNENTISELRKGSYTYFKNDDVLLAKVTPCFENGKCGIAKNLTNGIGFGSSEFIVFRPKDFIKSEFLYYFVSNKAFREEGAKNMGGAVGLQRVKKDWIENHSIPVPPLSEQEKIVEHLDQVSKEVKELKSKYQSQLDNLEELKKSVLDKAFKGEIGE